MDFLKYKRLGLSVIPLNFKKEPEWSLLPRVDDTGLIIWEPPIADDNKPPSDSRPSWKPYQKEMPSDEICKLWSEKCSYMGVVCGGVSGNLHCIDDDEKKNLVGQKRLLDRWTQLVRNVDESLLKKIILAKTLNKGFHILYRTEEPLQLESKNPVYAERLPVAGEHGNQALIETRTEGGYYCFNEPVRGSYDNIYTLTMEEHNTLVRCAKELNEVFVVEKVGKKVDKGLTTGLSPWEDYDQQTDITIVLDMLLREGWTEVYGGNGDSYRLRRPGKTSGSISATLGHQGSNIFYVFTSNSDFEPEKPYSPFQVLSHLEDDDDWGATALRLSKEGYGSPMEVSEQVELKNKLLQTETLEITDEEEQRILSRVSTVEDSMEQYLEYASVARNFILEPHLSHLEKLMKDIQRGHYVAWAGASGSGKTSSAFQAGNSYLRRTEQYGVRISLELANRDVALRDAMELSDPHDGNYVDKDLVTKELFSNEEFRNRVKEHYGRFYVIDSIYNVDVGFQTVGVLKNKLKREGKELGLVVWDFAQMAEGGFEIDKQPKLAQAFKIWSKKLDVATIALLQTNASIDKYTEPNENNISGSKMFFQTADHAFMVWKNALRKNRIIIKSAKERWSLEGRCDLVQTGMKIHSEEHEPISTEAVAKAQGNSNNIF